MRKQTEREESINIIRTHFKVNKSYIFKKDYILGIIEIFIIFLFFVWLIYCLNIFVRDLHNIY